MISPRPPTTGATPEQTTDGAPEARYDARYYDAEPQGDHWFTNNAAKRARRWREVLRMLAPAPPMIGFSKLAARRANTHCASPARFAR